MGRHRDPSRRARRRHVVASDVLTIADGGGRDNDTIATLSVGAATFDSLKLYATYGDQPSAPRVMMDDLALMPRRCAATRFERRRRAINLACHVGAGRDAAFGANKKAVSPANTGTTIPIAAAAAASHHRLHQVLDRGDGIRAAARVHGRGLDHRAARCGQPVEALASRQLSDRPGRLAAGADRGNRREVRADRRDVERRMQREQTRFVELDARFEERFVLARDDHADVDEFLALDARHDADHRVVIGRVIAARIASSTNARGACEPSLRATSAYAARCVAMIGERCVAAEPCGRNLLDDAVDHGTRRAAPSSAASTSASLAASGSST